MNIESLLESLTDTRLTLHKWLPVVHDLELYLASLETGNIQLDDTITLTATRAKDLCTDLVALTFVYSQAIDTLKQSVFQDPMMLEGDIP